MSGPEGRLNKKIYAAPLKERNIPQADRIDSFVANRKLLNKDKGYIATMYKYSATAHNGSVVFIASIPHSGSILLEKILCSHLGYLGIREGSSTGCAPCNEHGASRTLVVNSFETASMGSWTGTGPSGRMSIRHRGGRIVRFFGVIMINSASIRRKASAISVTS